MDPNQFNRIFQEAKARYKELERTEIELTFDKGWFFTMRASVKVASLFIGERKYIVNVNSKKASLISQLSEDDISAWFGHELAHIVDYETMSTLEFMLFSIRYVFDFKFRFSVEKRINAYACNNGFATELFGIWKKFLAMEGINKKYQNYIIKNYAPNWKDIESTAKQVGITEDMYKSLVG